MAGTHARYSASAAQRWLNCGLSVRLSAGKDDAGREAREGTLAHALLEAAMRDGLDKAIRQTRFQPDDDELVDVSVTDEMIDAVGIAEDWLRDLIAAHPGAFYETELALDDLKSVHPLTGGTADFVMVDERRQVIHIVDFKYGKGHVVDVQDNVQALTYAVGCLFRFHNYGIRTVRLTIIQPRAPHKDGQIRTWETSVADLYDHAAAMKEAIDHAESAAATAKAGPWCKNGFCAVRGQCSAYREYALELAKADFADDEEGELAVQVPQLRHLNEGEMRAVLAAADIVLDWVKQVQAYCHDQAMAGKVPTGFKLVPRRGRRYFLADPNEVRDLADAYFERDEYEPRKLLTVAQMEALFGKKKFATVFKDRVENRSSGYNLVPADDPRPERVKAQAEDEFE